MVANWPHYKRAMLSFENTSEKKITYIFKPWKQMVDKCGKTEALARLKAGTMKYRTSKSDKRFMEFVDAEELMSFSQKKKQGTSFNSGAVKASKDEWLQHDGMELDELSDKNFGLMKTKVDKMEMEPELRDFFKNQAGGDGSDGEGVEEDDEDDSKPILKNKNKANKWEELSQVGKADDKGSLQKKLLAFKAEITKDEAALSSLLIDMKKEPAKHKEEIVFVKSAIACLETSLKKCEKVLKSGLKKEECKSALIEAFQALGKSKKAKKMKLKKPNAKSQEDDEEEDE